MNGRQRVAAGSIMHRLHEAASGRPEKRKTRKKQGERRTRGSRKAARLGRAYERKPKRRALLEAAPARARRGQRRPKNGDDEQGAAGGQRPRSAVTPSQVPKTTICVS